MILSYSMMSEPRQIYGFFTSLSIILAQILNSIALVVLEKMIQTKDFMREAIFFCQINDIST